MIRRSLRAGDTLQHQGEHDHNSGIGNDAGFGAATDATRLAYIPEYRVYNREREMERIERERKEKQWEEELNTAMMGAEERLR